MSDCRHGGRDAYRPRWDEDAWHDPVPYVPKPGDREPGVLYQHPVYARKFYECLTAIEVYGIRFERVEQPEDE